MGYRKNVPLDQSLEGNYAQRRTDYQLHDQPGPKRIPKIWAPNISGMLTSDSNATPSTGDTNVHADGLNVVGHTKIPKYIYRPPTQNPMGLADDYVEISSPGIGMPL